MSYSPASVLSTVHDSPSKPEENVSDEANVPTESFEAVCSSFLEAESGGGRCVSPTASCVSSEGSMDKFSVDPTKIITNEMLEEEKRLYDKGVAENEKRREEAEKLIEEAEEDSKEKRYEKLKFLLKRSTLYTEYLVGRIKAQREEEEKRKERMLKRKLKKEQMAQAAETKNEEDNENPGPSRREKRKRNSSQEPLKVTKKRQKLTASSSASSSSQECHAEDSQEQMVEKKDDTPVSSKDQEAQKPESPQALFECGQNIETPEEEPGLNEKAATFGVPEDGDGRVINGEPVPLLQPKLMTGGVLRDYQVEGYSWLKVLYENGVNGILADEMGLGKTVQCVAILSHLVYMGIPGPFMVCAPLSTIPNWFAEFQRFSPQVPTILYHGDKDSRAHLAKRIRRRHKIREGVFVQPVVITSYEVAMIDRKYLGNHEWKFLIVDEGHRIKNTHCRLIKELRMYKSTIRLLLTGTPLQNNLAELWSLLNFLLPEIFNDLGSFEAWFDVKCMNDQDSDEKIMRQEQGSNILGMLHQILTPFMLRRLKTDVDLCIPPKKEIMVFAPLSTMQKDFYSALVDRTIFNLLDKKNNVEEEVELTPTGRPKRRSSSKMVDYSIWLETGEERKKNEKSDKADGKRRWKDTEAEEKELEDWVQAVCDMRSRGAEKQKQKSSQVTIKMRNLMMQLRKCCNHPYLLEHPVDPITGELALTEGVVQTSGKMLVLDRLLKELKKRGHRVLIFSQMTRMLDLIEDFCQLRHYSFCRLDGSTHVDDRRDRMNVFNDSPDTFLFLLSTRAGGLGINLTGADTVIIYDSDWNPQCDLQAQDRCHRIGQTKPVVVYRFVAANTIDQKIIERASAKRKLEKMVIHKGKFKSGNFLSKAKPISPEELKDLLQSKDHDSEVKTDHFSISQAELNSLLDRSDLYEKWRKSKEKVKGSSDGEVAATTRKSNSARPTRAPAKNSQKESNFFKVLDIEGVENNISTSQEMDVDQTTELSLKPASQD